MTDSVVSKTLVPLGGSKRPKNAHDLRVVRKISYGRWLADAAIGILLLGFMWSSATNPNFQWDVVAKYLTNASIINGLWVTLQLTVIAIIAGTAIGIVLALMMLSDDPWLRGFAAGYKWLFRGTPLLVQLVFWFNISALYPDIALRLPGGYELFSFSGNSVTPFMAAVLGLALHESAYMAEIVRGGILAVGPGQNEAATALGMRKLQAFWRIVLPQALRLIVPATGNQVILMLKTTSLVSVIALPELLYTTQSIYARTFEIIPLLIVASIWYLLVCSILGVGQHFLERKLGQGYRR
ncbi:amino acid ABC transporter permease [Ochrobactrum sp. Q0168]|uniref:amino acid ABC transporter permease n=1 Tax=Ochrobactrum sp. Q0168 TaxID=2793241 RepID=UPI0018EC1FD0|nr:amino acid ABC transporter permease [Ochrobactrum sp. Q0168]